MKYNYIILSLLVFLSFTACKDKMVCAAYQSTYLLDDERQAAKFSFFEGDSLILEASNAGLKKNIYGIKERDYGYWRQERLLVIDQEDIYSKEVDSLLNKKDSIPMEQAEYDPSEVTLSADSVKNNQKEEDPWANTKRFQYNVDFVNYMLLVGNDVLRGQAAARDSAAAKETAKSLEPNDSTANKPDGFFKKLFSGNKKEKNEKEKPSNEKEKPKSSPIIEQSIKEEDN